MELKKINYSGTSNRVLKIISDECPFIGYSYLRKILRNSDIKVNGQRIKNDIAVKSGDIIELYYSNNIEKKIQPVYEDDNIAIIFKPKKITSQGDNSFEKVVKNSLGENFILCHRLDTNTDGLLIFAKSIEVFDAIKKLFIKHRIEKHYLAEVIGVVPFDGSFNDYILKDSAGRRVFVYAEKKPRAMTAKLDFKVVSRTDKTSLLDITLITGRTHQIRAQLAYHGYPIVGDGKYGKEKINRELGAKLQTLTAYKIIFHVDEGILKYLNGKEISV